MSRFLRCLVCTTAILAAFAQPPSARADAAAHARVVSDTPFGYRLDDTDVDLTQGYIPESQIDYYGIAISAYPPAGGGFQGAKAVAKHKYVWNLPDPLLPGTADLHLSYTAFGQASESAPLLEYAGSESGGIFGSAGRTVGRSTYLVNDQTTGTVENALVFTLSTALAVEVYKVEEELPEEPAP